MKKKKVCVTGSLGLVGSEAVAFFKSKDWDVVGIDANIRSFLFGTPLQIGTENFSETYDVDIRDKVSVEDIFRAHEFDAIIHAAAQPSHDWAKHDPLTDFDINARGTLILLEAARTYCPDATFLYVSTDKVYGENMKCELEERETRFSPKMEKIYPTYIYFCKECNPLENHGCTCKCHLRENVEDKMKEYDKKRNHPGFDESLGLDFAGQRSLFGCSKTAADLYVQEYGTYFGMKTACFRPGCITGKRHQGAEEHGFLAYLAQCIKVGKEYKIFGFKGKQVRDIIHSYDLANAFWHFIEEPTVAAVYNIGGGPERSVSVLEAGEMIATAVGKEWKYKQEKERQGDRQWDVHDVSKFRDDYPDWSYEYNLPAIIKELCS